MNAGWAICLADADAAGARRLWPLGDVEVCPQPGWLWLRGREADERGDRQLRAVPGARRFTVLPDGQLLPPGALVPKGRLPAEGWMPLRRWLTVAMPVPALAGRTADRVALRLVRTSEIAGGTSTSFAAEPAALLARMDRWASYAVAAPQLRLDRWHFALCGDGRALVRGRPLPPLGGRLLVDREGILIPAGWAWSPGVPASVVRRTLGLQPQELALWLESETWEKLSAADFTKATRSAVRMSWEGIEQHD